MATYRDHKVGYCCYQCEDRYPACHDSCEKYKESKAEWLKKQAFIREAKKEDRLFNNYHIGRVFRSIKIKEGKDRK